MIVIKDLKTLEQYKNYIISIPKTNYQHTYENIYATHLADSTTITFISLDFDYITTFIERDEKVYECVLNIEPIIHKKLLKLQVLDFIKDISIYLNKTLYFPLVYENSFFYKKMSKNLYTYERLYDSIVDYNKIDNIINKILGNEKVYFSMRNVKKFESKLSIESITRKDVKDILLEIESNSWKKEKKQDMSTKEHQLIYYNQLIRSGVATLVVAYDKDTLEKVSYRLDAIFDNKIYVLKNSYKESYKKYSPGSYLLIYEMYNRYKTFEYIDLYGGPGLTKMMIETSRIKRFDLLYGDLKVIESLRSKREKWDELNYAVYLNGMSLRRVFDEK